MTITDNDIGRKRDIQVRESQPNEFPWPHVLLAGATLAVLVGMPAFGLPCLAVGAGIGAYLAWTAGQRSLGILILSLLLCLIGFCSGGLASWFLWFH